MTTEYVIGCVDSEVWTVNTFEDIPEEYQLEQTLGIRFGVVEPYHYVC